MTNDRRWGESDMSGRNLLPKAGLRTRGAERVFPSRDKSDSSLWIKPAMQAQPVWIRVLAALGVCLAARGVGAAPTTAAEPTVAVLDERPRLFLRAKTWDGPSVEQLKGWMGRDEYKRRVAKLKDRSPGMAILWMAAGDEAAGKEAVARLKKNGISGSTPSYQGIEAQVQAALFDWLHDHPDFDADSRRKKVAELETWGDRFMDYLQDRIAPTPFYSRISGALSGLTAIGIALHGDSPKAERYVAFAARFLREKYGTIRQVQDGATTDGSYGYFHTFTDVANLVAAFRSGTQWDAGRWIKENQGDWLRRQLLFQIWMTDPNGRFFKDGDLFSIDDSSQHRMPIDAITGMYHSGVGRTWADGMQKRWHNLEGQGADYHREYVWEFFAFNNPLIKPAPLDELGRFELFSPKLHGLAAMRDSWKDDATIIRFKCGDTVSHHATYDQGMFTIHRVSPLAIKDGWYTGGYKGAQHMYYKSPWSANVVIFDNPQTHGWQPLVDMDGPQSWPEWKARRDEKFKHPPTGVILASEANDRFARVLGDLSGSTWPTGSTWTRELVFLGYRYLLVLDRVAPGKDVKTRWLLHSAAAANLDPATRTATIDNKDARLFCRTLLPDGAKLVNVGTPEKKFLHITQKGEERSWPNEGGKEAFGRMDVVPADESAPAIYLHVLYATDTKAKAMPDCSVVEKDGTLRVKVNELEHTFAAPKK